MDKVDKFKYFWEQADERYETRVVSFRRIAPRLAKNLLNTLIPIIILLTLVCLSVCLKQECVPRILALVRQSRQA